MMRPNRLPILAALALSSVAGTLERPANATPNKPRVLYLQPLGRGIADRDVSAVRAALVAFYGLTVEVLPREPLPRSAYYRPRRRYRAEKLLDVLARRLPDGGFRILGLTAVDISTTKGRYPDWGVIGLATLDGRSCVISLFRCRKKARSRAHARVRLAKTAVHEIGHTLGLEHCPTHGCLMEDARGQVKTSDREHDLCPRCRARLRRKGHRLVERPQIPWPRPQRSESGRRGGP